MSLHTVLINLILAVWGQFTFRKILFRKIFIRSIEVLTIIRVKARDKNIKETLRLITIFADKMNILIWLNLGLILKLIEIFGIVSFSQKIYCSLLYVFSHSDGIYLTIYTSDSNAQLYCIWYIFTKSYERLMHTSIHPWIYPYRIWDNKKFTLNKPSSWCQNHKILLWHKADPFLFY